jgi:putative lipase involved disintegration of autophagic bodies
MLNATNSSSSSNTSVVNGSHHHYYYRNSTSRVILTGSRLTGGLAGLMSLKTNLHAFTFGAPAVADVTGKTGVHDPARCLPCLIHNVIAAGGSSAGIASASGSSVTMTSKIPCDLADRSDACQSDAFFSLALMDRCGSRGRMHEQL